MAQSRGRKRSGSRSAAKKPAARKSSGSSSRPKPASPKPDAQDLSGKSVADFRQALTERLVEPLNLVLLTRERIEEAVEEAVTRGSMTRDAAQDLVSGLVERGRRQTTDVLGDLEQLLGRGTEQVLAQADRARRVAGVGPAFPVAGYDDLTASQVQTRLGALTPAELRKVRDYEQRNANRKTVLSAIESKLA